MKISLEVEKSGNSFFIINEKFNLYGEKSGNSFFIINEKFNLYGEGDTLSDAIEDFLEILSDDYNFYINSPMEEFDEPAKKSKKILP